MRKKIPARTKTRTTRNTSRNESLANIKLPNINLVSVTKVVDRRNKLLGDALDFPLLWMMLTLMAFGILMVYSATVVGVSQAAGNPYYFLKNYSLYAGLALLVGSLAFRIPMELWERWTKYIFLISLILVAFLLVFGREINGARRWLNLGFFNLQPAETLKFAVILYLSSYLMRHEDELTDWKKLWWIAIPIGGGMGLIMLSQDLGSFVILGVLTFFILFLAGIPKMLIAIIVLGGVAGIFAIIFFTPWRWDRLMAFMNPTQDMLGTNYQLGHALGSLFLGSWTGQGLGNGWERYYLSEIHTDYILSLIAEEWGALGVIALILAFAWLIWRIFSIAQQAYVNKAYYSSYCAKGIALWFAFQSFIHIGVNIGQLPTKGLTLPFISYGGSSLMMSVIAIVMVLRIDYENRQHARGY